MAPAGEAGVEEGEYADLGHVAAYKARAQCEHVGVIVLARQFGGERFAHPCAAAAGLAIDSDRNADPRAADGDSALRLTRCHSVRELAAELGIIDAFGTVCAEVAHVMALVAQPPHELILEQVPGMIGGKSDAHSPF